MSTYSVLVVVATFKQEEVLVGGTSFEALVAIRHCLLLQMQAITRAAGCHLTPNMCA